MAPPHPASYPVSQRNGIEVDQQADPAFSDAKVGQQLDLVDWQNALYRLEFEDDLIVHDHVCDIPSIQNGIIVVNRQRHLAPEGHVCPGEFVAQAFFIDGLEQTWTEPPMHAHREADNPVGEFATGGIVAFHAAETALGWIDESLTGV